MYDNLSYSYCHVGMDHSCMDTEWDFTWNKLSTSVLCATILLSVDFFAVPPRGKSSSKDAMFDVVSDV